MVNSEVYQHFRAEEKPLIDSLNDYINQAQNEYRPILTHYLDPRQQHITQFLLQADDMIKVKADGGFAQAERKRLLFYPDYYEPQTKDFELQLLEINYPTKFVSLTHGQILGTLANSGLEREVLGDIITDSQRWQIIVQKNISDYLLQQVKRIGKINVNLEEKNLAERLVPNNDWELETVFTSSLRIDTMIATVYNISRNRVKELINAKKVQLNWMVLTKPDTELGALDIVSVRGFGRIKLGAVLGRSKRGKLRCEVAVIRK